MGLAVDWAVRGIVVAIVIVACIIDLLHNPLKHSRKFVNFRFINWFLVGTTYAGTYFGRYNMNVANNQDIWDMLAVTREQFGWIITVGFISYAVFVLLNGFIVDKWGGRKATIIGSLCSAVCNILLGIFAAVRQTKGVINVVIICILYAVNNYFQTYCTSAICKVGVNWYNIKERGFFSGIFGVIIAFGFFLAFSVCGTIKANMHWSWLFFIPGIMLASFSAACFFVIKSTPVDAGYAPVDEDAIFEQAALNAKASTPVTSASATGTTPTTCPTTGCVTSQEMQKPTLHKVEHGLPFIQLFKKVFLNPLFILFCIIDFCVGWCRDGVLTWFPSYLTQRWGMTEASDPYAISSAGVTLGGMFGSLSAGIVSDAVFKSRRPPVAFIALIGFGCCVMLIFWARAAWVAAVGIGLTSFFFSSVHGIITSTCAMDFAGSKATGTAVGMLDGIQKIGSSLTGFAMGAIIGTKDLPHYQPWLLSMFFGSEVGAFLVLFILHKKPKPRGPPPSQKIEITEPAPEAKSDETTPLKLSEQKATAPPPPPPPPPPAEVAKN